MGTQAKAKQSWEKRGLLSDIKIQGELDKLRTHTRLCEWEEEVPWSEPVLTLKVA